MEGVAQISQRWRKSKPGQPTRILASLRADCSPNLYKIPAEIRALLPSTSTSDSPNFHVFQPRWYPVDRAPPPKPRRQVSLAISNAIAASAATANSTGAARKLSHSQATHPWIQSLINAREAQKAEATPSPPVGAAVAAPMERPADKGAAGGEVMPRASTEIADSEARRAEDAREKAREHAEAVKEVRQSLPTCALDRPCPSMPLPHLVMCVHSVGGPLWKAVIVASCLAVRACAVSFWSLRCTNTENVIDLTTSPLLATRNVSPGVHAPVSARGWLVSRTRLL